MKIVFDKIGSTGKPIGLEVQGIKLEGTLQKSGYHRITLDAKMEGSLKLDCDRCGQSFDYDATTPLRLKLTDMVSEDKDDLDIIEFLDGKIDILYILQSEMNTFKSTYHYCDKCNNNDDEDFEVEY